MANTFHDLSTDSYSGIEEFQSNRAKDGFPKITPGDHPSPDSDRTQLAPVASDEADLNTTSVPKPQLRPTL